MLELVTIALLFVMFLSILIGVIDRFLLGIGLPWPEELARFLLVWGSLLSAAVATKYERAPLSLALAKVALDPERPAFDGIIGTYHMLTSQDCHDGPVYRQQAGGYASKKKGLENI